MTSMEDRLREHYRDELAGLDVPDLLPAVLAAGRRARRRVLATAIAGVAAAALVASVLFLRPTVSQRAVSRPASRSFTVITRTDLSVWGPVSGLAAVPGGVWLASWRQGELERVDARTGRVTVRLSVGPQWTWPDAIAYGAGSLWVTEGKANVLVRFDPATGRPLATIQLPVGVGEIAVGDGFVWVSQPGNVAGTWYRLTKINPVTDRVVRSARIPVAGGPDGLKIAASAAGMWVNADGGPAVQAVDPASLRLFGSAQIGTGADALTATGRSVWALADGMLSRIDPPWSAVARRLQLYTTSANDGQTLGDQTLVAGPGGTLWAAGPELYKIDETTMRAEKVGGFGPVDNVSVIGQTLWVQTDDGFLYQLALNSGN